MLENSGLERAVIASICQYGDLALSDIEGIVDKESFNDVSNQALFECLFHIVRINKDTVDRPSLLLTIKELKYDSLFETKKDIEYLGSLFNFSVQKDNILKFAKKLKKLAIGRDLIYKHQEAIESLQKITGNEHINEIIKTSEQSVLDSTLSLKKDKDDGPHLLFDNVEEKVQELADNKCDNIGIATPWERYNAAIGGGLRCGGVNLIGARMKVGKTTFAKEALLHFTNVLKIPALFLDTEMVLEDQLIRSISSESQIDLKTIETGKFDENHLNRQKVDKAVQKLKDNRLFWYESISGKSFEEVLSIIRRWIIKEVGYDDVGHVNDCVVIYDYFKLMDAQQLKSIQEYQAIGFQISRLTDFAKEFDFPCMAFVQLNRQNDISQSDRLRWFCHSYTQFETKEDNETADDGINGGNRKLRVLNTRFGAGTDSEDYICMNFQGDINKIREVGFKSEVNRRNNEQDSDAPPTL